MEKELLRALKYIASRHYDGDDCVGAEGIAPDTYDGIADIPNDDTHDTLVDVITYARTVLAKYDKAKSKAR